MAYDPKLEHLNFRASSVYSQKDAELQDTFGLSDDPMPKSAKELIQRIKDGKFIVPEDKMDKLCHSHDPLRYFRWRDPATKEDRPGYEAASKLLRAAYTKASDRIAVLEADKGLEALDEFEQKTFH